MTSLVDRLRAAGAGEVTGSAPLAGHTSYRVGGPVAALVQPRAAAEVASALKVSSEAGVPTAVIGWGSNLIVADEGFDGVVIKLGEAFRFVRIPEGDGPDGEGVEVVVGGATMNNHLVRRLHQSDLSGAEFLALVPGTFGGAVAMNAGTQRGETGDIVRSVVVVEPDGAVVRRSRAELAFGYRQAELPAGAVVVEGTIGVARGGVEAGRERVREERVYRNRTQPYHEPSAGSVFKNPEGDFAGRLIESAGLKGRTLGGARISMRHANFIVTEPGAAAADILGLMALARDVVRRRFGVVLEPEQRLLGFGEASLAELLDGLAGEVA